MAVPGEQTKSDARALVTPGLTATAPLVVPAVIVVALALSGVMATASALALAGLLGSAAVIRAGLELSTRRSERGRR